MTGAHPNPELGWVCFVWAGVFFLWTGFFWGSSALSDLSL
jgi:hypothetical protein